MFFYVLGEKYELAKRVNIKLINHRWLEDWYFIYLFSLIFFTLNKKVRHMNYKFMYIDLQLQII